MSALVLASTSPRRQQLLAAAGLAFAVARPEVDESVAPGVAPVDAALQLAARKARAVVAPRAWVVAADTLLDLDGEILGKPRDADDARAMLARLSGRAHDVLTGVCVQPPEGAPRLGLGRTRVHMRELTEDDITTYVATGEPLDKAGAYAIQGGAGGFVARIEGPFDNVVGLPMGVVRQLLRSSGYPRA